MTRTLHGQDAAHRNTDWMIACRVPRRPSLIHFIPSRLLPLSDLSRHPAHTPTHFLHSESSRSSRNTTPPLHVVRKALDGIHNDRFTGAIAASSTLIIMARPCRPFTVHVFVGPIAPLILHWYVSPKILNGLLFACLYDTSYADRSLLYCNTVHRRRARRGHVYASRLLALCSARPIPSCFLLLSSSASLL